MTCFNNYLLAPAGRSLIWFMVLFILTASPCFARWGPPSNVEPIIVHGLKIRPEYEKLPTEFKVWLVAERVKDNTVAGKTLLYSRQYTPDLPTDFQEVYLSSLIDEHDTVIAQDERGRYYAVDPLSGTLLKNENRRSKIDLNFAIAQHCFRKKNYDEAVKIYQENRQACLQLFGPNDLSIAMCDANMAHVLYTEGQDAKALSFYERAMTLAKAVLVIGPRSHLYAKIKSPSSVADLKSDDGWNLEAKQSVPTQKYQIESDCLKGINLADTKQYADAETCFKQMATKYEELRGNKYNPSTACCLLVASLFFDDQEKYRDSAEILTKALADYLHCGWSNPDYSPYLADVQSRIRDSWIPPAQKVSKCAVVDYQVYRDGQIAGLKVAESSGNPLFDQAALATIEKLNPFPVLPSGSCYSVTVQFTFHYNVMSKQAIGRSASALNEKCRQQLGSKSILFMMLPENGTFTGDLLVLASLDPTITGKKYKMMNSTGGPRADGTYFYPYNNDAGFDFQNRDKEGKVLVFPPNSLSWSMVEISDRDEAANLLQLAREFSTDRGIPQHN